MKKRKHENRKKQQHETEEEMDSYIPSDSEAEMSDTEKILLNNVRKGRSEEDFDSADEVFGIHSSGSDDENEIDIASDIEDKENDGLPDVRAWGKKKKSYYNTDYVDPDYGGFDGKDAEAAELEEQEARNIQKRLLEQLDEADFSLDFFAQESKPRDIEKEEEIIKTDVTKLSRRQKLALVQKESPEYFGLVEDFQEKINELKNCLAPVMTLLKCGKLPDSQVGNFIKTRYHLILNYCTNIAFYVLLKARRTPVQCHPVTRRLFQYRELLKQIDPIYKSVVVTQIDTILKMISEGQEIKIIPEESHKNDSKRKLHILSKKIMSKERENGKYENLNMKLKRHHSDSDTQKMEIDEKMEMDEEFEENSTEEQEAEEECGLANNFELHSSENDDEKQEVISKAEEGKRGITYEMAKNRGLTPYRRKELRNPRVKHRMKYRKAIIRRKGQVRTPKQEIQKYSGEVSGIKASVVRSIKLK